MALLDDIATDLDVFFNASDFGVTASYTEGVNPAVDIVVLFDNPFIDAQLASAVGVESSAPRCQAKTSDVDGVTHGDTLTIGAITYSVIGVQPDGNGITTLILQG